MLFWANAVGSVALTASIVMCVPPVSGGVEKFGVDGVFPSMVPGPQLVMANVAAAKAIRYRTHVVFTVSAGTEQDDISALPPTRPCGLLKRQQAGTVHIDRRLLRSGEILRPTHHGEGGFAEDLNRGVLERHWRTFAWLFRERQIATCNIMLRRPSV